MNEKQMQAVVHLGVASVIIGSAVRASLKVKREERAKRKVVLDEMGLDVAAIHNATDVVNGRIERGEIRNLGELREAVLTEVAFQKITIREDD